MTMFKTKEQIEEMAKGFEEGSAEHGYHRAESYRGFRLGYIKAQKDLLESASANGMDYWSWYRGVDTSTFMGSLELAGKDGYEAGWQACSLLKMKELQEKDEEIEKLNQVLAKTSQYNKLAQDEITKLKKALDVYMKLINELGIAYNMNLAMGIKLIEAQKQIKDIMEGCENE